MNILEVATHEFPSLETEMTLDEAWDVLSQSGMALLPVLQQGQFVGTLSERELAREGTRPEANPARTRVSQVYNDKPLTCSADLHLRTALQLMRKQDRGWLVVLDREGFPRGMVTPMMLIDQLLRLVPQEAEGPELGYVKRVRGGAPAL